MVLEIKPKLTKVCPSCGVVNTYHNDHCKNCGRDLLDGVEVKECQQ